MNTKLAKFKLFHVGKYFVRDNELYQLTHLETLPPNVHFFYDHIEYDEPETIVSMTKPKTGRVYTYSLEDKQLFKLLKNRWDFVDSRVKAYCHGDYIPREFAEKGNYWGATKYQFGLESVVFITYEKLLWIQRPFRRIRHIKGRRITRLCFSEVMELNL